MLLYNNRVVLFRNNQKVIRFYFSKKMWILSVFFALLLNAQFTAGLPRMGNLFYKSPVKFDASESPYKWTEEWFKYMPIDHFSYADERTFQLRYFINLDHYTPGGPIFFYTGNEGNLEAFTINTVSE